MALDNYLEGKRVCLVAPSPYLLDIEIGELIDSYDCVVRLNQAIPVDKSLGKYYGVKTNILYNCHERSPISGGDLNHKLWKAEGIDRVVCPYPFDNIRGGNVNLTRTSLPCDVIDVKLYSRFQTSVGAKLNTGMLAIMHLLEFNLKELFVCGMTFFRDGYHKEYKNWDMNEVHRRAHSKKGHQQPQQESYFKNVIMKDKRVVVEPNMLDIINKPFEWNINE